MEKEYDLPEVVFYKLASELQIGMGGTSVNRFLEGEYQMIRICNAFSLLRRYRIDNDELFMAFLLRWS